MSKWRRVILTVLLTTEVAVTLLPVVRGLLFESPPAEVAPGSRGRRLADEADAPIDQRRGFQQGVLLATTMLMLVTAVSALAAVWSRPGARTWVVTFTGTHVAAAGLGWVHDLPSLTLLAVVSSVGVPLLVLTPPRRGQ